MHNRFKIYNKLKTAIFINSKIQVISNSPHWVRHLQSIKALQLDLKRQNYFLDINKIKIKPRS